MVLEEVLGEEGEVDGSVVPDQDRLLLPQDHPHQVDQDHLHGHQVLDLEDITTTNHITVNQSGKERKDIIQHTTSRGSLI